MLRTGLVRKGCLACPLLAGEISPPFAMTEPEVASSDVKSLGMPTLSLHDVREDRGRNLPPSSIKEAECGLIKGANCEDSNSSNSVLYHILRDGHGYPCNRG